MLKAHFKIVFILIAVMSVSGCTFIFQPGRRSDAQRIQELSEQLDELSQVKKLLEGRLAQEIADKQVKLEMMEKGLVITFLADILFDSGKAKIKPEAMPILDKVSVVLKENVPEFNVGIEGHTDNEPIKFSGWKSNWELSTARALSVLHYLMDEKGIVPERLSAVGYGEFRPVTFNDSSEGRRLNRRVEVVILPKIAKVKPEDKVRKPLPKKTAETIMLEPQENLK